MLDNTPKTTTLSRRQLLEWIGKTAGAGALYETMVTLGMLQTPASWAGPLTLPSQLGAGKTVAILGAGMAGLAAAYELQKAGYHCIILETLDRPGGRNLTARRGTKVVEDTGPHGRTEQICQFDEGLYANLGPGRLPFHHERAMHYCKEFAIPLEVYVMTTTANLFQTDKAFNGKAMPRYRLNNDVDSHIAEMLTKAVDKGALDDGLTTDDRQALKHMLRAYAGLPIDGSRISGADTPRTLCVNPTTVQAICEPNPRLPLKEVLKSDFWSHRFFQPVEGEWEPTLFQPIGGMDKFVDAFVQRVGSSIRYNAQVIAVMNEDQGVHITYLDRKTGKHQVVQADYCLSNMPLPKLAKIKNNFSPEFQQAVDLAPISALYKLAWQANRRFWEEPPYNIFGGISYTDSPMTQLWYPSYDYMTQKGTLPGSYAYDTQAETFGHMTLPERIAVCRRDSIKLHPEFADETLIPSNKAVSIAWNQAEGQSGGYATWDFSKMDQKKAYERLLRPDGNVFVIGDQVSPLPGWQEGAFLSTESAIVQMQRQRSSSII